MKFSQKNWNFATKTKQTKIIPGLGNFRVAVGNFFSAPFRRSIDLEILQVSYKNIFYKLFHYQVKDKYKLRTGLERRRKQIVIFGN